MIENKLYSFDKEFKKSIIGVDEAGRGPLAGPVVAAAVRIDEYLSEFDMINDSKKLSEKRREKLFDIIMENCEVGVGVVHADDIDSMNILNGTFLAMRKALNEININDDLVLVDGNHKIREYNGKQQFVIKGDANSLSIAAASIIAKVTRDRMMKTYADDYPEYKFEKHKGYGTKEHREILKKIGACKIHRKSFLTKILAPTLF